MKENGYRVDTQNQEKQSKFFECVKRAADISHTIVLAQYKSQKAKDAIATESKETKWTVLQEYIKAYRDFINKMSVLTALYVFPVDENFYNNITLPQLNQQLQIAIDFVYLREALMSAAKETYKACLKKLLKQTGLFDSTELNRL